MSKINKKHTDQFKMKVALEALKGSKTVAQLCQDHGVATSQIYAWKQQLENSASVIFKSKGSPQKDHAKEIEKLHATIGKLKVENDFLEKVLGY